MIRSTHPMATLPDPRGRVLAQSVSPATMTQLADSSDDITIITIITIRYGAFDLS